MADADDKTVRTKASSGPGWIGIGLAVGLIWLGWQIALVPMAERAPSEHAVRLNPGSAAVLARAAESEWQAGRMDNADALARMALERAPFTLSALRVVGLVEGESGDRALADEILTLAGNWSLRDDSSHGWLIENRLRRGDYGSAFAHADTLARRRASLQPQIFDLFATAVESDPRAFPFLAGELADDPPWRTGFLRSLYRREGGVGLAAQIAILMKDSSGRFSDAELQQLYLALYSGGQIDALRQVRDAVGRPTPGNGLVNGNFQEPESILPFGWKLGVGAGYSVAALPGAGPTSQDAEEGASGALRIAHNGQSRDVLAEQALLLSPGRYRLEGLWRWELGQSEMVFAWQVLCGPSGQAVEDVRFGAPSQSAPTGEASWQAFSQEFTVPETSCPSQTLRLVGESPGRRTNLIVWFAQLEIAPLP